MQKFFYSHFRVPHIKNDIRKLFKEWHGILIWYEEDREDLPYWYLERTNVGHLALAGYQLNGYPLQEFSIKKGRGSKKSTGRADLYMYIPKGNSPRRKNYEFNIEAKQEWCSLSMGKDQKEMIRKALKEASDDLQKLNEDSFKAEYGMAIVFVIPYKRALDQEKDIKKQLLSGFKKQIKQIAEEIDASFVAIHFADIEVSASLSREYTLPYWHPGIAVVGKICNMK